MPLPRTLCRFPLQAAAMRSLPRSGLVQYLFRDPYTIREVKSPQTLGT